MESKIRSFPPVVTRNLRYVLVVVVVRVVVDTVLEIVVEVLVTVVAVVEGMTSVKSKYDRITTRHLRMGYTRVITSFRKR